MINNNNVGKSDNSKQKIARTALSAALSIAVFTAAMPAAFAQEGVSEYEQPTASVKRVVDTASGEQTGLYTADADPAGLYTMDGKSALMFDKSSNTYENGYKLYYILAGDLKTPVPGMAQNPVDIGAPPGAAQIPEELAPSEINGYRLIDGQNLTVNIAKGKIVSAYILYEGIANGDIGGENAPGKGANPGKSDNMPGGISEENETAPTTGNIIDISYGDPGHGGGETAAFDNRAASGGLPDKDIAPDDDFGADAAHEQDKVNQEEDKPAPYKIFYCLNGGDIIISEYEFNPREFTAARSGILILEEGAHYSREIDGRPLLDGQNLSVYADPDGSSAIALFYGDIDQPEIIEDISDGEFTVDFINATDIIVTGSGIPKSRITVEWPDGLKSGTLVGIDGFWAVAVPLGTPLKDGDELSVTQTEKNKAPSHPMEATIGRSRRRPELDEGHGEFDESDDWYDETGDL